MYLSVINTNGAMYMMDNYGSDCLVQQKLNFGIVLNLLKLPEEESTVDDLNIPGVPH